MSPGKVRRGGALMLRNVEPSGRTEKPLWAGPNALLLFFWSEGRTNVWGREERMRGQTQRTGGKR